MNLRTIIDSYSNQSINHSLLIIVSNHNRSYVMSESGGREWRQRASKSSNMDGGGTTPQALTCQVVNLRGTWIHY